MTKSHFIYFRSIYAVAIICILLILTLLPFSEVQANGPAPSRNFYLYIANVPEDMLGIDMLVPENALIDAGYYTELNEESLSDAQIPSDCALASYNEDGFVSIIAHFEGENVYSLEKMGAYNEYALYSYGYGPSFDFLMDTDEIRLAIYDAEGNVLTASPVISLKDAPQKFRFYTNIYYDCGSGYIGFTDPQEETTSHSSLLGCGGRSAAVPSDSSAAASFSASVSLNSSDIDNTGTDSSGSDTVTGHPGPTIFTLIGVLGIVAVFILGCALITAGIEVLVAFTFRIRPVWRVALVTFITNVIMNIVLIILQGIGINYWLIVIAGELLAVAVEMFIYFLIYRNIHKGRIVLFSFVANAASFLVVYLLTQLLSFTII